MEGAIDNGDVKVSISEDDAEAIINFGKYFNIPQSPELIAAVEAFKVEPTVFNQNVVKRELCRWMLTSDHAAMQDELWDIPKEACKRPLAELDFLKELDEVLSDDNDPK
jgi:hypothetical protein